MPLYFAYGSNLNHRVMRWRCPDARALGKFTVADSRLVFRVVADCTFEEGAECVGGLWLITERCERALDRFEGVGGGSYRKEFAALDAPYKGNKHVMYYVMNSTGIMPPGRDYSDKLRQGYKDFGLSLDALEAAIQHSRDNRSPTQRELNRIAPPPPAPEPARIDQRNFEARVGRQRRDLFDDDIPF